VTGDVLYRRTQIAWPTIVPLVVVAAALVPVFVLNNLSVPLWISAVVWSISLVLFATLTVTVTSDAAIAAFGIGLVHKTLPIGDIVSFAAVRNSWAYGFGIHYFPGGVLWNASGLSAVEFKMGNGRYVRIGTAEPESFVAAVRQATGRTDAPHQTFDGSSSNIRNIIGIAGGVFAIVVTGVIVYSGFRPPAVTMTDAAVSVSNGVYRDVVPFDTMQALTLESAIPRVGIKTNGFSARNTLRGSFRVDGWGSSRLYINADAPPFVVIRTGGTHVVVNFKDPGQTRRLYVDLRTRIAKSR
jgi:hypothetical protein